MIKSMRNASDITVFHTGENRYPVKIDGSVHFTRGQKYFVLEGLKIPRRSMEWNRFLLASSHVLSWWKQHQTFKRAFMTDTMQDIERIFHPRAISIIGSSSREGSFGRLFLEGMILMGYQGIYPVHPREKELLGLKAYPNIKEIPVDIDLAISLVPRTEVLKVVQECAEKGVKGLLLFTSGFKEKDEEGKQIELKMAQIARKGGVRLIGPNANGIYCPAAKICTFPGALIAGGLPTESGNAAILSQSGSFADYACQILAGKNIRFSKVVGYGNESDLGATDFLEYFGKDKETRVIAGYLEGVKNGRGFYELAKKISKQKPIIIWKGGLTESGARAALAHTGSLAGSRQVWEAMFKQAGIISVNSLEEIADCVLAFSWLPLPKGRRVAILSGMAGTNVGTADNCLLMGLEIAKYTENTIQKLSKILPAIGTTAANPTDIGAGVLVNPELYGKTAKILLEDENVDMVITITGPDNPATVKDLANVAQNTSKPMVVSLFDIAGLVEPQVKYLQAKHVPVYLDPKRAAFALAKMTEYAEFRDRE
jgi:acyl-CoA synthetase (NDP forming)